MVGGRAVATGPEIVVETSVAETSKAPATSCGQRKSAKTWERRSRGNGIGGEFFAGSFQIFAAEATITMFAAEATDYSKKSLHWKAPFGLRATMPSLLRGVQGASCENERSLLQPFQTRVDANRKSGGQDRERQDIGFERADPGAIEAPRTQAKI
jgi:hypothetical protein